MWISSVEFRIHYDIYYPQLLSSIVSLINDTTIITTLRLHHDESRYLYDYG